MCRACTHSARLLPAALSECRYTVFFALSCAVSLGSLAVKIRLLIEKMQSRRKEMRQQSGGNARRLTVAGVPMKVPRTLSERDAAKADRLRAKLEANRHEKRRYYCTRVPAAWLRGLLRFRRSFGCCGRSIEVGLGRLRAASGVRRPVRPRASNVAFACGSSGRRLHAIRCAVCRHAGR